MFTKKLFPVFIFLLVSVLFFSCEKEEASLADLNFKVEEIDGVYHCSWTATNISTFEKYYIVHSPTLMNKVNEPTQSFSPRWTSVYSQTTNFTSIVIGGEEDLTLYFQLFVDIDDRMIRSNVITFEKEVSEVIDFDAKYSVSFPDKNAIYFYDTEKGKICYYDYLEEKIKKAIDLPLGVSASIYLLAAGNNGFGDEIYGVLNHEELIIINANTLEIKETYLASGPICSIVTNDNGMIVLSISNGNEKPIQIISRNNLSMLNNNIATINSNKCQGIAFLSKENNELVSISEEELTYYKLDDLGNVLDQNQAENPYSFSNIFGATNHIQGISPGGNYFVSSGHGYIFDASLNAIGDLSPHGSYSSYFFNKDETKLYAFSSNLSGNIFGNSSYMYPISIPDMNILGFQEYEQSSLLDLFYRGDEDFGIFYSNLFKCIFIKPIN